VLAHYFETKDELLRYSLADPAWLMNRFDSTEPDGLASVRRIIERLLPLNAEMRDMWRVWMTFWVSWPGDPSWDEERRLRQRRFRRFCRRLIRHARDRGELDANLDAERSRRRAGDSAARLGVQAVMDPRAWPQRRQLAEMDDFFTRGCVGRPGGCDVWLRLVIVTLLLAAVRRHRLLQVRAVPAAFRR
jgi:hypothetical protein